MLWNDKLSDEQTTIKHEISKTQSEDYKLHLAVLLTLTLNSQKPYWRNKHLI